MTYMHTNLNLWDQVLVPRVVHCAWSTVHLLEVQRTVLALCSHCAHCAHCAPTVLKKPTETDTLVCRHFNHKTFFE